MLREKVYKPILPLEPTSKTDAFAGCRVGSCSHGCVLLFCWFFFFLWKHVYLICKGSKANQQEGVPV